MIVIIYSLLLLAAVVLLWFVFVMDARLVGHLLVTTNLPINIVDFRGFDSNIIVNLTDR